MEASEVSTLWIAGRPASGILSFMSQNYERPLARLHRSGELHRRVEILKAHNQECRLCPKDCGLDRTERPGPCGVDSTLRVGTITPHFGEEPPIAGTRGAGAVFFTGCHMRCVYCQNWQISQAKLGATLSPEEFAGAILQLQERGCHNLDLVSPTHFLPGILEGLEIALDRGFCLPIVYNSNGYEVPEVLRLLDGIVDVYLPDAKYADDEASLKYSAARGYSSANEAALEEMFRQVGNLVLDDDGIAQRGLIVRHLVLPNNLSQTREVLERIVRIAGPDVHVSLMAQYQPVHKAQKHDGLERRISAEEYQNAFDIMTELGMENGWCQEPMAEKDPYLPDFHVADAPFEQGPDVTPVFSGVADCKLG